MVVTNGLRLFRYETAKLEEGVLRERPVIRLPGGIILTRIDPANRDTSMIMRIRPGWDALRAFLAPELFRPHPRADRLAQLCQALPALLVLPLCATRCP